MVINLFWSDKIQALEKLKIFKDFTQRMANRLIQGEARYGPAKKEQCYMSRLCMEVKAYKKNGNMEHLLNIANYCILESMAPENNKFHFDNTIDSVTRKKMEGKK